MNNSEPDLETLREAHALLRIKPDVAIAQLKMLAQRRSVLSMLYLAHAFRDGTIAKVDVNEVEKYYQLSVDNGSLLGSYELGRFYLEEKKYNQARRAFEIGVAQHFMPSQQMLGRMYMYGIGVTQDNVKAEALLREAADQGHVFAKRNLAVIRMRGNFNPIKYIGALCTFLYITFLIPFLLATDRYGDRLR